MRGAEMFESIRSRLHRLFHEERGVALTEFALVAPILFIALFAIIDFGKAINYWNDQTQLAAQGARMAAVSGSNALTPAGVCLETTTTKSNLADYIQCQADTNELLNGKTTPSGSTAAEVCISLPGTSAAIGQPIRVIVKSQYTWIPLLPLPASLKTVTIQGAATMRLERPWTSGAVGSTGATCP
jgi:Flp pilus assembly protein TadG